MSDEEEASVQVARHPGDEWDSRIACMLKQVIRQQGVSYEWLAQQVAERRGCPVSARWLERELNGGGISAPLFLQIVDSLGVEYLSLEDLYPSDRCAKEVKG